MRFCNWRPLFSLMLLFLTRRSWSLRKQQSLLHCASRSTTVWEESSSRRWVSPPRSVLKAAGPWATFFFLRLPPCDVLVFMYLSSLRLSPHLCDSFFLKPPTMSEQSSILFFHSFPCTMPFPKMETSITRLLSTNLFMHTCPGCTPVITFIHCLNIPIVTAAVSMEINENLMSASVF